MLMVDVLRDGVWVIDSLEMEWLKICDEWEPGALHERLIGPGVPLSTIIEVADKWRELCVHIGKLYPVVA